MEGFWFQVSRNRVLPLRENLAAALGLSATQDACASDQDGAQHNQATGFRKRINPVNLVCNNFMELTGRGKDISPYYEQQNTENKIGNFFHNGNHHPSFIAVNLDLLHQPRLSGRSAYG